jgi:hypothetical protein
MIRKTEKLLTRRAERMGANGFVDVVERVRVKTWWLLFVPVYRSETVEFSNL